MLTAIVATLIGASPPQFNAHWFDSKAEIDAYRLVQPRYGQLREGTAVMIWVTEPFSVSKHVKLDAPEAAGADRREVMKLNFVRRFLTGIYDYNLLTSVFSPLVFDPKAPHAADRALKVTFGSQEWCGNTFHQLDARDGTIASEWRSYFESEGDGRETFDAAPDLLLEDELWFRIRGLTRDLAPGTHPFLPSLMSVRLSHAPMVRGTVQVSRAKATAKMKVPAGEFMVGRWDLALKWGRQQQKRTVWREEAFPHRLIAWEGDVAGFTGNEPSRERAELTGSIRDAYWKHNRLGDDALRQRLGLPLDAAGRQSSP